MKLSKVIRTYFKLVIVVSIGKYKYLNDSNIRLSYNGMKLRSKLSNMRRKNLLASIVEGSFKSRPTRPFYTVYDKERTSRVISSEPFSAIDEICITCRVFSTAYQHCSS